jgi:broad specificity phosphatase PhoE
LIQAKKREAMPLSFLWYTATMLPRNLVLVRHGQSEFNLLVNLLRKGRMSFNQLSPQALSLTGSKWRLTSLGRQHAEQAGDFIRNHLNVGKFHGCFVSDYVRAKETAGLLGIENASWKVEPHLRERNWGDISLQEFVDMDTEKTLFKHIDAFYGAPPCGESIANLCLRVDRILDTLHREYAGKNVLIVCHGELMWGFRVRLERMLEDDFVRLDKSKNPFDRIHNGQILHYQQVDESFFTHMRSICPSNTSLSSNDWTPINRKLYSNEDLLNDARNHPTVIE